MKRKEYKLLVENWNSFLIKEEENYSLIEQSIDSDAELSYLLEWGDNLERLIIESGDFLLLESLHESNSFLGKLIKLKDKVKSSFKVRQDVVDDEGNKVKYDDSEESQVKQEYTALAKTGMSAMAAIKIACIVSAALSPHGLGSDKAPDTFEELPPAVQQIISSETGMDSQTLSKVQHITFDAINIGPRTQTLNDFDNFKIGPSKDFNEKIALAAAKNVADEPEKVKKETALEILDKLGLKGGLPDGFEEGAAGGEATSLGIDTSGPVTVLNSFESTQEADMELANNIVKLMASQTDLGKTDVKTRNYTPSRAEFGQTLKNFKNLDKPTKIKLLRAAKFKAIKDLLSQNPKLFEKAKSWTSTVWGFEGEGSGKVVSDMNHHNAEGSKEARALASLYSTFTDVDFDIDKLETFKDLERVLKGHNSFTQVTGDNSIAGDIEGSIITYVMKNCTDIGIAELKTNLSKIPNIDKDLDEITMPATEYKIRGTQKGYTKLK
jgi:hypothetical protein